MKISEYFYLFKNLYGLMDAYNLSRMSDLYQNMQTYWHFGKQRNNLGTEEPGIDMIEPEFISHMRKHSLAAG